MPKIVRLGFHDHEDGDRQTASLAGLAVTLVVIVVCVFLLKELHMKSAVEDCLMAGRANCDEVLLRLR
jgi:hypothetical protein